MLTVNKVDAVVSPLAQLRAIDCGLLTSYSFAENVAFLFTGCSESPVGSNRSARVGCGCKTTIILSAGFIGIEYASLKVECFILPENEDRFFF